MFDGAPARPARDSLGCAWNPGVHFSLDTSVIFLNHGSFGAVPKPVQAEQSALRALMEREPVRFQTRILPDRLAAVRQQLAAYLGCDPEGLAFARNATAAMAGVLRSLRLKAGDEVVITDHGYNAVTQMLRALMDEAQIRVIVVPLGLPIGGPDQILAQLQKALTPATRLVIVDHVTSPTAAILPITSIVQLCRSYGARVMVDGAHGPGMMPLQLDRLEADWYIGNCHKWLFAPRGSAFLWTAKPHRETTRPAVASHFHFAGYTESFDWIGTDDPTGLLSIPAALAFRAVYGERQIIEHNQKLANWAADMLTQAWGAMRAAPEAMTGSMAAIALPGDWPATEESALRLHNALFSNHRIEIPIKAMGGRLWVRISAQIYNTEADYFRLRDAILSY